MQAPEPTDPSKQKAWDWCSKWFPYDASFRSSSPLRVHVMRWLANQLVYDLSVQPLVAGEPGYDGFCRFIDANSGDGTLPGFTF
jgi:hypothetical protein